MPGECLTSVCTALAVCRALRHTQWVSSCEPARGSWRTRGARGSPEAHGKLGENAAPRRSAEQPSQWAGLPVTCRDHSPRQGGGIGAQHGSGAVLPASRSPDAQLPRAWPGNSGDQRVGPTPCRNLPPPFPECASCACFLPSTDPGKQRTSPV